MFTTTRSITILILAACTSIGTAAEDSPTTPKERTDFIWTDQNKEINADLKKLGSEIDLAFIGDSITRRWRGEGNKEVSEQILGVRTGPSTWASAAMRPKMFSGD